MKMSLKDRILTWIRNVLGITGLFNDLDYEIGQRLGLINRVNELETQIKLFSDKCLPMVLLTGEYQINEDLIFESSWCIEGDTHAHSVHLFFQPDVQLKVKSIRVLSPTYKITSVRIANCSLNIASNQIVPPGGTILIPPYLQSMSCGNGLTVMLSQLG
jgi:hypothetical protein